MTLKYLILMRHAEAKGTQPGRSDHERSLTDSGRLAARLAAGWLDNTMKQQGFKIDHIWCSTAVRSCETLEQFQRALPDLPKAVFDRRIYTADDQALLHILQETPEQAKSALVIGHNPTVHQLTHALLCKAEVGLHHFPTAAMAVLGLPVSWSALGAGVAHLIAAEPSKQSAYSSH